MQAPHLMVGKIVAVLMLWLAGALAAPPAVADDEIGATYEIMVDPDRTATITKIAEARFSPIESTFGGGFTEAAYWLRISFPQPDPPPLKLRFRPTTTDRIELYTPLPDGTWRRSTSGEITAATWDASARFGWYGFRIDPKPGQGPFYARITTASPGAITVSAVPLDLEIRSDARSAAWHGFNFALQLLAIVLVLKRLDPLHSLQHFAFLAMITSFATYLFWFNGYAHLVLGNAYPWLTEPAQEFFATLTVLSITAFHYLLLRDYDPPRVLQRALLFLMAAAFAAPLLRLAGHGQPAIRVSIAVYALLVPLLVAIVCTLSRDSHIPRRQVRAVYAVYILVLITNITLRMGWIDDDFLYRNSVEAISMVTTTLMLMLLWLHHRMTQDGALRRDVELARMAADLAIARRYSSRQLALVRGIGVLARRLDDETRAATERNAFRTAGAKVERSVAALRAVIERCLFAQEAEDGLWNVTATTFQPAEAIRDIASSLAPPERWVFGLDPFSVDLDRGLFDLAVRNVLANAQRYGNADDPVRVSLHKAKRGEAEGLQITVENTCTVDPPFDPERVFNKFYRGPSAQSRSGTGLGLFIAREVLAPLSGEISLKGPQPGGPAVVTARIWIPAA